MTLWDIEFKVLLKIEWMRKTAGKKKQVSRIYPNLRSFLYNKSSIISKDFSDPQPEVSKFLWRLHGSGYGRGPHVVDDIILHNWKQTVWYLYIKYWNIVFIVSVKNNESDCKYDQWIQKINRYLCKAFLENWSKICVKNEVKT